MFIGENQGCINNINKIIMVKHAYLIITKILKRGNYYLYLSRLTEASSRILSKKDRARKSNPGHIWISEAKMT